MRYLRPALLAALVGLGFPVIGRAQTMIRGTISDSAGARLAGVILTVDGTGLRVSSDARGGYQLSGVPAGNRVVRARMIGFQPAVATVTAAANTTVILDFTMARSVVQLAPVDVVVGSRARHTAAEELAVPVDVITSDQITRVATTETSQVLQELAPSINFPRQSVSDASDIVRPFTMRGLNPDHSLVLVNGSRRHRTSLVHVYNAGMGAGGSGVDMNAIPSGAIERMEVLRDGAAAQYGSDAIAGVVNVVLKDGEFSPFLTGQYGLTATGGYPTDGELFSLNGGMGFKVGRGTLALFGEYRDRQPTNRAGADNTDQVVPGDADEVDADGNVIVKNNDVPQPNHHWGDGLARDVLTMLNFRLPVGGGSTELYAFGGYSYRNGTGNGYRRVGLDDRNWPEIYPLGYLPQFEGKATDWSAAGGARGVSKGWNWDLGLSYGYNDFDYDLSHTMNVSLGPCLDRACAPGLDGILGTSDDPGIPNQTEIYAGSLNLNEFTASATAAKPLSIGLAQPLNVAVGVQFRSEGYGIVAGEPASYIQGGHLNRSGDAAPPGSQVFPGFTPDNAGDHSRTNVGVYLDLENELAKGFLVNAAARFESYSDFGERLTGKLALRYQASNRLTLRAAGSTGFRAPALAQSWYASTVTNFSRDPATGRLTPYEVGIFPVDNPASQALGATPLRDETATNFSGGFAFSPSDALSFTLDAFYIKVDHRIMLTNELSGETVEQILAGAGVEARAARYFSNALDTKTTGMDFTASYRRSLNGSTRLDVGGYLNFTRNRIEQIRVPEILQGTDVTFFDPYLEGGTVAIERERPEWRGGADVTVSGSRLDGSIKASYYGKFESALFGYAESTLQTYGAKTLFDLEGGWRPVASLRAVLGVRNLFDTYPDRMSADNGFGLFLHPPGSPFGYNGRFVYARMEWTIGQ
ncbi:MAG TPA: TonB-dependent receptor [Gemmatimonadales bacterium]